MVDFKVSKSQELPHQFRIFVLFCFADDSLLFFKATPQSCEEVKDVLHKFGIILGEFINYNKSLIKFFWNTP